MKCATFYYRNYGTIILCFICFIAGVAWNNQCHSHCDLIEINPEIAIENTIERNEDGAYDV